MEPTEHEPFQVEAEQFAAFLAAWLPTYRRTRRRVALSQETPKRIRWLWEAVRYSAALSEVIASPVEVSGRRRVRGMLARWREVGETGAEVAARLSERYRLVQMFEGGFLITDESLPGDDAPVVGASESLAELMPEAPSYIYYAANSLLRLALGKWFNLRATFAPATGSQPFPLLLPNVVLLGEDILAWSDGVRPETPPSWVAFRSVRGFIQYVGRMEGRTLARCPRPPGHVLALDGLPRLAEVLPELRRFELSEPDLVEPGATLETTHHVGLLDGAWVWLSRTSRRGGERFLAGVDPDDRDAVVALLAARGVHIVGESPP